MGFATSLNSATAILLMMNPPWHSSGPLGRSGRKTSGRISTGYKYKQLREGLLFLMFMRINTLSRTKGVQALFTHYFNAV